LTKPRNIRRALRRLTAFHRALTLNRRGHSRAHDICHM
jgi:hypothetical protein